MLINLLHLCDFLLVALILLPSSNQRSINSDRLRHKNETTDRGAISPAPSRKVDNFVDDQCPPNLNNVNIQDKNEKCRHECNSDSDCTEDYSCCEQGCSLKCTEPWFPNTVVDWEKSSSLNQISESLELPGYRNDSWKLRGEPCSTSILDGLQPLRCPTDYVCQITMNGDVQLNIPNRGECIRVNEKKSSLGTTKKANSSHSSIINIACSHKGETYKHKDKFRKDCNMCVCHSGVVFCDNQPCPSEVGIPAAISSFDDFSKLSQTVFIDSERRDTRDASGSSGSGWDLDDTPEDDGIKIIDDDVLVNTNASDSEKAKKTQNADDGDQEVSFISGDDDETTSPEVNERDDEDDNSGDNESTRQGVVNNHENSNSKVIHLERQGEFDDLEFSGEPESIELETEVPLKPRSSAKTEKPKNSYSTRKSTVVKSETSTSALKLSTLPRKISTSAPKIFTTVKVISTLKTDTSTIVPTAENEMTSKHLRTTKSTEKVIRLEKSNSKPGELSFENFSGDNDEDFCGSGDDDYGSSDGGSVSGSNADETQKPEPPVNIILHKYIRGELEGSDLGFESDNPRIEVVNDGPLKSERVEGLGDVKSVSGKKEERAYKTKSQTAEYLKTTDDEN